ncbi:ABC transporter ATP-binding protein [Thiococcus pfennigii]|uniref:ABC transporter ATP-binding protein n=1 Tax=Thiococcus pfennigii TaxID=1057 RepID=UPI001A927702|nr:ABC transporter ATP-binding protein [Thiococcus pfennigii]MBK1733342.1 ABC transporter [Thiococcus pfennigii]
MSMPDAIVAEGLAKRFEEVDAVAGISFRVRQGELFGFLGPNGAGKSTTINLLTGLARPDAGSIRLGGIDCTQRPRAAQHLIGVVPDESNLYPELSGYENLTFCGALYGLAKRERETRARELLDAFGLAEAAARKFGGYSKGMKRRLTIAAGIIHRPEILFLDEPTTGIDVASARQLRQLIAELHRAGTTIFLTTHYIEEAERLCERIAFIVAGRIVQIDSVEHLLQPLQGWYRVRIVSANGTSGLPDGLAEAFPTLAFSCPEPGVLEAEAGEPIRVGAIVRVLEERGIEVVEARRLRPSLEEVFVRVTGIATDAMRQERERAGGGR